MSGYGTRESARETHSGSVSIPFLVAAAVLCGIGIFGLSYWLVTLNWFYFAALLPLAGGAVMLFMRGTGPDRA